jgi:hypothetical protein
LFACTATTSPAGQFDTAGCPDHNTTAPCHGGVRSEGKCSSSELEAAVRQTEKDTTEKRRCLFSTTGTQRYDDALLGCDWSSDLVSTTSGPQLLAYDDHHRGVQLTAGGGDPAACYQELVTGKDRIEDAAQMFQDGQQAIPTVEVQDDAYGANGCVPSGCKVLGRTLLDHI